MGFLGGGFFGSGAKQTTSSVSTVYDTETNTQQTDQSGNSGLNLSNIGGGVSLESNSSSVVNTLDGGAIRAATDLSTVALDTVRKANDSALDFGNDALGFGSDALNRVAQVNADSLELLGGLVSGAIDNSKTVARDSMASNSEITKAAINGFQTLATQNSASSDDRLQKVVQYALVAVALVMIVPPLFRGSKGAALA